MAASRPAGTLAGTSWHLVAHRVADEMVPALTTPASTLVVEDERLHGTTGVNDFNGGYTTDGQMLSLGAIAMTLKAGFGAAADQEAAVVAALGAVAAFRLDEGELVLVDAGGDELLRYEPLAAAPLLDTVWDVLLFRVGDALTSPLAGSEVTLLFAADGGVNGSTGCNRFHGQYVLDADELAFAPLATTRMIGSPELMEQEMAFLSALTAVARADVTGDRLRLCDLDGATVVDARAH